MARHNTTKGSKKITIELDLFRSEKINAIKNRRKQSGVYEPRQCSATQIVKDGIDILFRHEYLGESIDNSQDPRS